VWLDASKTSPYAFYQFWLNTDDADVYRFLRYYTFLSVDEIARIEAEDAARSGKPQAQQILAENITAFVHGEAGLASAQRISDALFSGAVAQLSRDELAQLELDGLPCTTVSTADDVVELLIASQLASSKRQAREWLANGAIRVNGEKLADADLSQSFALFDRYYLLQRGKKQFALIKLS
ncbi:MAG: S4 domain-containing protein, partial [Vibrio fluvialis]